MKRLLIISHTEHYIKDGEIVGLNSTVTEINHLLGIFDKIVHIAMLHKETAPQNTLTYCSDNITFVALPAVGGKKLGDKLQIIANAPKILGIVHTHLKDSDYFQFRAPTGIGVFVIPYLIASKKQGWFKYAGNWQEKNLSLSYRFQRFLLKNQKRAVTLNGNFESQPSHCLSFDNPCLSGEEYKAGKDHRATRTIDPNSFNFCFVGRLENKKGLDLLIQLFLCLDHNLSERIEAVHIIGEGNPGPFKKMVTNSKIEFIFYGACSRSKVHTVFKLCDALILPSVSEGFPKVIAEALNYGCIPIVSALPAIRQFIETPKKGFVVESNSQKEFLEKLIRFMELSEIEHRNLLKNSESELHRFTYRHYNKRIIKLLAP